VTLPKWGVPKVSKVWNSKSKYGNAALIINPPREWPMKDITNLSVYDQVAI